MMQWQKDHDLPIRVINPAIDYGFHVFMKLGVRKHCPFGAAGSA
jgi:hypothetical protein